VKKLSLLLFVCMISMLAFAQSDSQADSAGGGPGRQGLSHPGITARAGIKVVQPGGATTAPDRGCTEPASGHLTLSIFSLDSSRGQLTVSGLDDRRPRKTPLTWVWGDNSVTYGWLPQSHTFTNTKKNYLLQVISHEDDGSTDCARILIPISTGRIVTTSIAAGAEASIGSANATNKTNHVPGVAALK
jgi:hypothetical protein